MKSTRKCPKDNIYMEYDNKTHMIVCPKCNSFTAPTKLYTLDTTGKLILAEEFIRKRALMLLPGITEDGIQCVINIIRNNTLIREGKNE